MLHNIQVKQIVAAFWNFQSQLYFNSNLRPLSCNGGSTYFSVVCNTLGVFKWHSWLMNFLLKNREYYKGCCMVWIIKILPLFCSSGSSAIHGRFSNDNILFIVNIVIATDVIGHLELKTCLFPEKKKNPSKNSCCDNYYIHLSLNCK